MTVDSGPGRAVSAVHGGWRRGDHAIDPHDVVRLLREAAQHRARRALRLYGSEDGFDQLDAAADAGTAVELLAKACVATVEPAALAKGVGGGLAAVGHVLRLRGHGHRLVSREDDRLATIDASLALTVVAKLFPRLTSVASAAACALDARNDSLHMGVAEPDRVQNAIAAMAHFVREALPVLGVSREEFWGEAKEAGVADRVVVDRSNQIAEIVEHKISRAQARYEQFVLRVGEDEARRFVTELQRRGGREEAPGGFARRCPACGNYGRVEVDADFDVEPDEDGGYIYFQTAQWIDGFRCPVCELALDGDETTEAGISEGEGEEDDD